MHSQALNIIKEARTWIGVKWRHQGRTREGVDCIGIIQCTAKVLALTSYDNTLYRRVFDKDEITEHFRKAECTPIPYLQAKQADILIIREFHIPYHCVLLSYNEEYIIHAHAIRRKVVEELYTEKWRKNVVSAWRLPE